MSEIWTIGHSTRTLNELVELLKVNDVEALVDVRSFPGSRKFPHFNKESLAVSIPSCNIEYVHFKDLGGRRKVNKDSLNISWRHPAFRGYADYMETSSFDLGMAQLEKLADQTRVCYMCSEAVWWRCHRSMISDYLKSRLWKVNHILGVNSVKEHSYTQPAKILNGKLSYHLETVGPQHVQ